MLIIETDNFSSILLCDMSKLDKIQFKEPTIAVFYNGIIPLHHEMAVYFNKITPLRRNTRELITLLSCSTYREGSSLPESEVIGMVVKYEYIQEVFCKQFR